MSPLADVLFVGLILLDFYLLGSSRIRSLIQAAAAQGVLLGVLLVLAHGEAGPRAVLTGLVVVALKGVLIPGLLSRALRDVGIRREVEPLVGFVASLLLVGAATAGALVFAASLPLAPEHAHSFVVPASLATLATGFLVLTTRRKAITQVVGYLTLENGVFVFGLTLVEAMPLWVEVGVLLDLLVGIFVMGIIINRIQREFSSIDTEKLSTLRD